MQMCGVDGERKMFVGGRVCWFLLATRAAACDNEMPQLQVVCVSRRVVITKIRASGRHRGQMRLRPTNHLCLTCNANSRVLMALRAGAVD